MVGLGLEVFRYNLWLQRSRKVLQHSGVDVGVSPVYGNYRVEADIATPYIRAQPPYITWYSPNPILVE